MQALTPDAPTRARSAAARATHAVAARQLAERDPVMKELLSSVGLPKLRPPLETHFAALVRSILYQQLAGSAAAAIHARLLGALGGSPEPERVLALSPAALRDVGLSASKAASLHDLASKVLDGTVVLDARRLAREPDEEVIARLSSVRGIGRWTAQMFLLFQLRRLDVWPAGDLGVRRGYALAYRLETMPSERQLAGLGDHFSPYRSVAAWYCWRACELYSRAGPSAVTT